MARRPNPAPVVTRVSAGLARGFSKNLDEHVAMIERQVARSIRDGESRRLAVQIVSGSYDYIRDRRSNKEVPTVKAYGKTFMAPPNGDVCPPKNDQCEIERIWDFLVLNFRYTEDPVDVDTFQTLKESLSMGGGDCFPVGTLVLRDDGCMVPIEAVGVGDRIHDGREYVEVLKTWDRGLKPITRIGINNGTTLRLSDTHKVLRVPKRFSNPSGRSGDLRSGLAGTEEECEVHALQLGDDLLQPREFGGGSVELDPDDAFLVGAYLAEGCCINHRPGGPHNTVSLAGVADRKGIRERAAAILTQRGIHFNEHERELRFKLADVPFLADLGRVALEKHLPHLNWGPVTAAAIVSAMEQGDGGMASNGKNLVYSTVSYQLALQYRVLKRMLGCSTFLKRLDAHEHGGFGNHPIYRVTVRVEDQFRPWARIQSLLVEPEEGACVDIMTSSGRVYLPECDVVVRQCDDATIAFGTLFRVIGYNVIARVVSTTAEPNRWAHIYPLVGTPKNNPTTWVPLDLTVEGAVPGWEYANIAKKKDYVL